MSDLRQSTAKTVKMGPFLDDADGKTAETGLSIAQADIRLSKGSADIAQTHNDAGATHDELGIYDVPLDTTDTDTAGGLDVFIAKAGALPVWRHFNVLPQAVYDAKYSTGRLGVNLEQIAGSTVDAAAAQLGVNVVNWKGNAAPNNSGDSFSRLGVPTGASIAADIATRLAANAYTAPDNAAISAIGAAIAALNDLSANDAGTAVLDALLADHDGAGSVGAAIAAAGSAGDPWASVLGEYEEETAGGLFAALVAAAALIKLKTDTLGSASVTVTSPVSAAGTVEIEQGDSYPIAHGRIGIPFTIPDTTHSRGLDGADCTVSLRASQATWEAASVESIEAGYLVTFTPTVAETQVLNAKEQTCKIVAVYDADPDDVSTVARAVLITNRDIPALT